MWYICHHLEPKELMTFLETDKTCRKITLDYIGHTMVKSTYIYYESFPYVIKSEKLLRKYALQRELSLGGIVWKKAFLSVSFIEKCEAMTKRGLRCKNTKKRNSNFCSIHNRFKYVQNEL